MNHQLVNCFVAKSELLQYSPEENLKYLVDVIHEMSLANKPIGYKYADV